MVLLTVTSVLVICILLALHLYFKECYKYWEKRNVLYEKPKFLFGSLADIIMSDVSLGKYIGKLYNKFDVPYFGMFIINNPILVIKDPEILKKVLVKDFDSLGAKMLFEDDTYDPIFCNTLMGMGFEKWKCVRPKVTPIFSSGKMKMMMHLIKKCGEHLETYLDEKKGNEIKINNVVENYTANVISSCIFGIDCNCFDGQNSKYKYYGSHLLPRSGLGAIKVYSYHFIHSLIKIFNFPFLTPDSAKFFRKIFTETLQHRRELGNRRNDLIDILLDQEKIELKNNNFKFDEKIMLGQAIGIFVAGYDTSTVIISLLLYEITINPKIQTRLRKEIHELLENFGDVTYESLDSMKYTNMVISETLRKYPVVNFIQRKCVKKYVVSQTNLTIDEGTNIIVPTHGLHYDEKYFPNSKKFDPERFNDENKDNINQYVYMPFSIGPRSCIGKRFALMSIKIALIYILKNFKLEKNSETIETLTFKTSQVGHTSDIIKVTCLHI